MDGRKNKETNQMGQHRSLLETHLTEFMWRQKFSDCPFENLIHMIQHMN